MILTSQKSLPDVADEMTTENVSGENYGQRGNGDGGGGGGGGRGGGRGRGGGILGGDAI